MNCTVDGSYISAACNATPGCMDWGGAHNWICYGACNSVVVCNPEHNGVHYNIKTLNKHLGRVNSVSWLRQSDQNELISGSSDKTAIVWQLNGTFLTKAWILQDHKGPVTSVDGLQIQNCKIVATSSVDCTVKIWIKTLIKDDFTLAQNINLGRVRCLILKLFQIPLTNLVLLALGMDNDKIYLYVVTPLTSSYVCTKLVELSGHEDWVRGLDFIKDENNDIILASSSQDTYIRLWKIHKLTEDISCDEHNLEQELKTFSLQTNTNSVEYSVGLESVLSGHENWIYSVHWKRLADSVLLLSSSMDKTMIVWNFNKDSNLWLESVRVGEVGGNSLGFFGAKFSPIANKTHCILGHSYQGSFHLWVQDRKFTSKWLPSLTVGGHYGEVIDLTWEKQSGDYLLTSSLDQTTRLHAQWINKDREISGQHTWHEIARPQIHGHDMSSICSLSRYRFVSGAEEKVIRVFQATNNFVENFHKLTCINVMNYWESEGEEIIKSCIQGASVPSLGLSNKAVYHGDKTNIGNEQVLPDIDSKNKTKHVKDIYPENYFSPLHLQRPPTEDDLMQNTLWPEIQKLYGHGYEIFATASSPDAKLVASACKASNSEHASIIIWSTKTWKQRQKLQSHQLTVTQLEFSPDGKKLLSVSRDRHWTVFELTDHDEEPNKKNFDSIFERVSFTEKTNGVHTRIIWCCAWMFDSRFFVTGSRDGKVVIWGKSYDRNTSITKSTLGPYQYLPNYLDLKPHSITAIDVYGDFYSYKLQSSNMKNVDCMYMVAVGTESGTIFLYSCHIITSETGAGKENLSIGSACNVINQGKISVAWTMLYEIDTEMGHHLTVRRLKFRPINRNNATIENKKSCELASCGVDHAVKIYTIKF